MKRILNRTQRSFLLLSTLTLILFQNCSPAHFSGESMDGGGGGGGGGQTDTNSEFGSAQIVLNNGAAFTNSSDVSAGLTANASEMYLTSDATCSTGGTWEAFAQTRSWALASKNATATVYAKFKRGTLESGCVSDSIVHDDTFPILKWDEPLLPAKNTKDITARFRVIPEPDLSGIAKFECRLALKGSTTAEWSVCQPTTIIEHQSLPEGTHKFSVRATDAAGNVTKQDLEYSWIVDNTAPIVTIKSPSDLTTTSNPSFEFEVKEANGHTTYCRWDANPEKQNCTSPATQSVDPGSHQLIVRAVDQAGNEGSAQVTWTYTPQVLGELKITGMTGGADVTKDNLLTAAGDPTVNWEQTTNAASYKVSILDQGGAVKCAEKTVGAGSATELAVPFAAASCPLAEGAFYNAVVKAFNQNGSGQTQKAYVFQVDRVAPVITIAAPAIAENQSSFTLKYTVTDSPGTGVDKITCKLTYNNNVEAVDCLNKTTLTFSNRSAGAYKFEVAATDKAAHASQASINFTLGPQTPTECDASGATSCLLISDSFERATTDIAGPAFAWHKVVDDMGCVVDSSTTGGSECPYKGDNVDIFLNETGKAPYYVATAKDKTRAAYFTGRAGGSIHSIFLVSKPLDLSKYTKVEFTYYELLMRLEQAGGIAESFALEYCNGTPKDCGVSPLDATKIKSTTVWKPLRLSTASSQTLNGRNHTAADWKQMVATLNLTTIAATARPNFVFRFKAYMDEGYKTDNTVEDAVALDMVTVRATK